MAFLETAGNTMIQILSVRGNERSWNAVSTRFQSSYQIVFTPHILCFTGDRDNFCVGENDLDCQLSKLFREVAESVLLPGFDIGYQLVHSVGWYCVHRMFALCSMFIVGSLDMCLIRESYGEWDSMPGGWGIHRVSFHQLTHATRIIASRNIAFKHHLWILKRDQERLLSTPVRLYNPMYPGSQLAFGMVGFLGRSCINVWKSFFKGKLLKYPRQD